MGCTSSKSNRLSNLEERVSNLESIINARDDNIDGTIKDIKDDTSKTALGDTLLKAGFQPKYPTLDDILHGASIPDSNMLQSLGYNKNTKSE